VSGVSTREARTAVARTGAVIDEIGADYVIIDCHPETANQIRALGYQVEERIKPLALAPMGTVAPMSLVSGYHTYSQMVIEINQAVVDHPTLVKVFSIGKSYEGRDIWAAKVNYDVGNGDYQPEALFIGGQHAREHIGVEMTLNLLKLLTDRFSWDMRVQNVVASNQIYIIFNSNPDGSEYDIANPPTDSGAGWRKNRQPNAGLPDVLTNWGTDLNRNFDYNWGCCGSAYYNSHDANQPTYNGPSAFSAPENQAIRDFINGRMLGATQRIRTGIAFHSHAQEVLWPFGYTDDHADMPEDDNLTFTTIGGLMAQSNGYVAKQSSADYITSGDVSDWAYGTQGIFMYTFEMGSGGNNFYPPSSSIGTLTDVNHDAVLQLLENTACPQKAINMEAEYCRKTSRVTNVVSVPANSTASVRAVCPTGSVVVGGGYQGTVVSVTPHSSVKSGNGWIASGKNTATYSAGPSAGRVPSVVEKGFDASPDEQFLL
jgi:murein tripeptide amidase MpaA